MAELDALSVLPGNNGSRSQRYARCVNYYNRLKPTPTPLTFTVTGQSWPQPWNLRSEMITAARPKYLTDNLSNKIVLAIVWITFVRYRT
jgi:hypothetical protein